MILSHIISLHTHARPLHGPPCILSPVSCPRLPSLKHLLPTTLNILPSISLKNLGQNSLNSDLQFWQSQREKWKISGNLMESDKINGKWAENIEKFSKKVSDRRTHKFHRIYNTPLINCSITRSTQL